MKTIYALLGTLCVGLGAIGTVVPGMPTTVFLIVAAWLYARSCPGLHRRLMEHRVFGPYLRMAERREMPRRAKIVALAMMWGGIGICVATVPVVAVQALVVSLALIGSGVVLFWVRTASNTLAVVATQ